MLYTLADKCLLTLVSCLHATPQPFLPKTANAVVFAPLLHHPRLELVFDNFPLINLRRRIFLLATPCLGLGLQPLDLESQALQVQPGCEIFKHDRIIQEDLFVPRWDGHVVAGRCCLDGLGNLWENGSLYCWPASVCSFDRCGARNRDLGHGRR
jgi:hypothetical protein